MLRQKKSGIGKKGEKGTSKTKRKTRRKVLLFAAVLLLFLLLGLYLDLSAESGEVSRLQRGAAGEDAQEVQLLLDAGDLLTDYPFDVTVEAKNAERAECAACLEQAKQQIGESFYEEGEDASRVSDRVQPNDSYVDGLVKAEWTFSPAGAVNADGTIETKAVSSEGEIVSAAVWLTCGEEEEIYQFSFMVCPKPLGEEEQLLTDIEALLAEEGAKTGEDQLMLPQEADGISLTWRIAHESYFAKFLFLAVLLAVCVPLIGWDRKREADKEKKRQMQLDYPGIVSKFLVLTDAGMSASRAWERICSTYGREKREGKTNVRYAYEQMVTANRQIADGESRQKAWLSFGERTNLRCYRRFARILTENQTKGTSGRSAQLQRESEEAFREREVLAKKLGEEASTKLLLPMMLLLIIVLAIVIAPALMSYSP